MDEGAVVTIRPQRQPEVSSFFPLVCEYSYVIIASKNKGGGVVGDGSACDRAVCGRCGGAVTFSPFFMFTRGPVSSLSERSITFLYFNCYHYSHHLGLFGVMLLLYIFFYWYVTHAAFPRRI